MGKRVLAVLVAVAAVVAGYSGVGRAKPAAADDTSDVVAFLSLLNQERANVGAPAVHVDPRLVDVAQGWSNKMAAAGAISHNPDLATQAPDGWTRLGENVGVGGDVPTLHQAFVNSPHHYENIIEPRYNVVGIAVARAGGALYVTFDFAANTSAVVTAAQSAPTAAPTNGYWLVGRDGGIFSYGTASFHGSTGGLRLNQPVIGMTAKPDHSGYWFVAADGGVFGFDAPFHGSTGSIRLNSPIVGMASTPTGNGYWLVARDGGIFAFGDARFYGSTGALSLKAPIVGMTATPTGNGYWLVGQDGGLFAFGDAGFYGSTATLGLRQPVTAMAATPSGHGYWLTTADGGVYAFGDAGFAGSAAGATVAPVVGISPSRSGHGYRITSADGAVFNYGDAEFDGSLAGHHINAPIVGMAAA